MSTPARLRGGDAVLITIKVSNVRAENTQLPVRSFIKGFTALVSRYDGRRRPDGGGRGHGSCRSHWSRGLGGAGWGLMATLAEL
ncbi:hypothetical protein E2C01_065041 [Portunus trituberculatus]|uniref:Uncharacterized protein n=1 Tax=Portunus trituberculatus TaxID=210409 RepID=A0A5B7HKT7_PORTR|nr:hypothetical protein [Portunus trituberculatus]